MYKYHGSSYAMVGNPSRRHGQVLITDVISNRLRYSKKLAALREEGRKQANTAWLSTSEPSFWYNRRGGEELSD